MSKTDAWWNRVRVLRDALHDAEMELSMAIEARDDATASVTVDDVATEAEAASRDLGSL